MPLIVKLAARNLLHDRLRFIATIVGIVFSIVLVTVQMGLFISFSHMITTMIAHARADLWIMTAGTKCFEDPSQLDDSDRFRALSVKGVTAVDPIVVSFAPWRTPDGGTTPIFVVGSNMRTGGLHPWNLVEGSLGSFSIPDAVAVDKSYFSRLGISGLNATAEIRGQRAQVEAVTEGIRSFTTTPFVFATLDRARAYTGTPHNKSSYLLVHVAPDADLNDVRQRLAEALPKTEVLTAAQFESRSRSFWLFGTGAGAALFGGALLGVIVGTVIVAQTLYSSTKDHLTEFATLRAIGSSGRYIYVVIVIQALISAIVGFGLAALVGVLIVVGTAASALPVFMTPLMTGALFGLTVFMCIISAVSAIVQVMRVDPATVFSR